MKHLLVFLICSSCHPVNSILYYTRVMMTTLLENMRKRTESGRLKTLNIKIESADTGARRALDAGGRARSPVHGIASWRCLVVLAETAAAIGAALNTDLERFTPVGVEINANHLRSVSRDV